jgi:hypothetical protein
MNTRLLMTASAVFTGLLGGAASFLPQEILTHFGAAPDDVSVLVLQFAGALYLGFAMLNWMARANLIGGIYSRPVAMGNFLHFTMGALVLVRAWMDGGAGIAIPAGAGVYSLFAVGFGTVLFSDPVQDRS